MDNSFSYNDVCTVCMYVYDIMMYDAKLLPKVSTYRFQIGIFRMRNYINNWKYCAKVTCIKPLFSFVYTCAGCMCESISQLSSSASSQQINTVVG